LQAAIASCHARARSPAETDWARIAALYDALIQLAPSPVVELNRAVALRIAAAARGFAAALSTRIPPGVFGRKNALAPSGRKAL